MPIFHQYYLQYQQFIFLNYTIRDQYLGFLKSLIKALTITKESVGNENVQEWLTILKSKKIRRSNPVTQTHCLKSSMKIVCWNSILSEIATTQPTIPNNLKQHTTTPPHHIGDHYNEGSSRQTKKLIFGIQPYFNPTS